MYNHKLYFNKNTGLYYLSKVQIKELTECLLLEYMPDTLNTPKEIDIEALIEKIGLSLEFKKLSTDQSILGAFIFNKGVITVINQNLEEENQLFDCKTILIDDELFDDNEHRARFTLGHELRTLLYSV